MALNLTRSYQDITNVLTSELGLSASEMTGTLFKNELQPYIVQLQNVINKIDQISKGQIKGKEAESVLKQSYAAIEKLREVLTGQKIMYRVFVNQNNQGSGAWAGFELDTQQILQAASFDGSKLKLNPTMSSMIAVGGKQIDTKRFNETYEKVTNDWMEQSRLINWNNFMNLSNSKKQRLLRDSNFERNRKLSARLTSEYRNDKEGRWVVNYNDFINDTEVYEQQKMTAQYKTTNEKGRKVKKNVSVLSRGIQKAVYTRRSYDQGQIIEAVHAASHDNNLTKKSFLTDYLIHDSVQGFKGGDYDRLNPYTSWQIKGPSSSLVSTGQLKQYLQYTQSILSSLSAVKEMAKNFISPQALNLATEKLVAEVKQRFTDNPEVNNMLSSQIDTIVNNLVQSSIGQFAI